MNFLSVKIPNRPETYFIYVPDQVEVFRDVFVPKRSSLWPGMKFPQTVASLIILCDFAWPPHPTTLFHFQLFSSHHQVSPPPWKLLQGIRPVLHTSLLFIFSPSGFTRFFLLLVSVPASRSGPTRSSDFCLPVGMEKAKEKMSNLRRRVLCFDTFRVQLCSIICSRYVGGK